MGYWEQWGKDSNYEVLVPEQTFQLDVYDEHGNFLGVMVGTVDAVVRDLRTGRIGFLEHKTGKDLEPFGAPLIMDEQAGTYWTFGAMFLEHQGLIESANDLDFVLYNRLRKAIPDTRPKDEQGRALNRDGSVSKNQPVPLFKREYTWRDAHDRQAVYDRVAAQMHELQWAKDGDFFIYKSTDRHCGYCEFKDVCEVHETGGDWEQMFDSTVHNLESIRRTRTSTGEEVMARPTAIRPIGGDTHHRIMVYGEPGIGKTVFAGSSPKALFLTSDDSEVMSAAALGSDAEIWPCPTYDQIDEAWEYLRHEGHEVYDWVWVDNLTLLQDQAMDRIMEELVASKPHRNRWVPDQHEYLVNQNRLSTMVRSFKQLPMHVGFTCHVMKSEDADGKILYLPMLQGGQGALSQKICGLMNVVGHMAWKADKASKSRKRVMYLEKHGKYLAKGRHPGAPSEIVDPTVPLLTKALAGNVSGTGGASKRRRSTSKTTRK